MDIRFTRIEQFRKLVAIKWKDQNKTQLLQLKDWLILHPHSTAPSLNYQQLANEFFYASLTINARPTPYLPGATRASWAEMPRNWTAPHIFLAHCTLFSSTIHLIKSEFHNVGNEDVWPAAIRIYPYRKWAVQCLFNSEYLMMGRCSDVQKNCRDFI